LIESTTLLRDDGGWSLARPLDESDISSTIHGVISGRIDRLEKRTKRILQEASVIGRAFFYEILKKVTELTHDIDRCLRGLEQLDLIRTRSLQPYLEYVFKHALTQEVAYNGLLRKERQAIHERIALVMEQLFTGRLSEFYEVLAFHFKKGESIPKAVHYLMKSGEKSLRRFALEESHQYYKEAHELLTGGPDLSVEDKELLIALIIEWTLVYYFRGDWKGMGQLLEAHKDTAECIRDKEQLGMFYSWLGFSIHITDNFAKSYEYCQRGLDLGAETGNERLVGYASTWMAWLLAHGVSTEAITYARRAHEIAKSFEVDQYLYFKSLAAIATTYWWMGESSGCFDIGRDLTIRLEISRLPLNIIKKRPISRWTPSFTIGR
jgi:hypothetical protein